MRVFVVDDEPTEEQMVDVSGCLSGDLLGEPGRFIISVADDVPEWIDGDEVNVPGERHYCTECGAEV